MKNVAFTDLWDHNEVVCLKKGAQFKTPGGIGLFFLAFTLLIICIILGKYELYTAIAINIAISILILIWALDFRGVIVDKPQNRIKHYKSFLGIKLGAWESLQEYNHIYLSKNVLVETDMESNDTRSTHFYNLLLVDENEDRSIPLKSYENYYHALAKAKVILDKTGFRFFDQIKKREL